MDKSSETTPPKSADTAEQRIFDAAHEVFVQKGLDGAKMQEIADRAGINKALLHYYYRSKEKLYEAVVSAVVRRAFPMLQKLLESDDSMEQKISRFIDLYIDVIGRNPFVPMFVINEMNKRPEHFFDAILPRDLPRPAQFFRQVEAEIAAGRIRPIQPQHLLVNVVSMCIFPFIAKPMIRVVLGLSPAELAQFLSERKAEVKSFVFASLRP